MSTDVSQWCELGSPNVSDALRACGKPFQAMDGGITPLSPKMKVAGPAFTVGCYPGATYAMEQALEAAAPGDVLIVDGGGGPDVILMGGLMSTRMQARGVAGAVVDAAVRDVDDIVALGFPVFSRHVTPRAGTFDKIGEVQTIVCCGRIPVRPGDWVVGDRNGVVVVPIEVRDEVFAKAKAIHAREAALAVELKKGKSFPEAIEIVDGSS
jgi:4-hydroxy-4-methyl-2-oxoglutarate aldolase